MRRGRPKQIPNGIPFMFYLDRNPFLDFEKLCEEKGLSTSEGVRRLIEKELELYKMRKEAHPCLEE